MATAFGPQTPFYATTLPTPDPVVETADTWFKNCSAAGVPDGTVRSASWYNIVTGNLRTACVSAGITLDDTDHTMLWQAIQQTSEKGAIPLLSELGVAPTAPGPRVFIDDTAVPNQVFHWDSSTTTYVSVSASSFLINDLAESNAVVPSEDYIAWWDTSMTQQFKMTFDDLALLVGGATVTTASGVTLI